MKQKFIDNSLCMIQKTREIDRLEEKKLKYGLEAFYNVFVKSVVLIILSILFHTVWEIIGLTIVYSTLRLYGFGIHMKTSLQCWFTTIPLYLGGSLLIKYFEFPIQFHIVVWAIGFISFLLFAPADTKARPLIHKEKRIRAKILSLCILIIYFILFIHLENVILKNIIVYAIFLESLSINPLVYKLFKMPFNNYKTFNKV